MKKKLLLLFALLIFSLSTFSQIKDTVTAQSKTNYCDAIKKTVDEFSGEKTYEFRIDDNKGGHLSISKVIDKKLIVYYLSIWIKESGIYTGEGVTIILKGGKKINKPSEVVEYSLLGNTFYTKAFMSLKPADIIMLKENGIDKYKLYISESQISDKSDLCKELFNCLISAK